MRRVVAALMTASLLAACGAGGSTSPSPSVAPGSRSVDPNFDSGQALTITAEGPVPKILVASQGLAISITNASERSVRVVAVGDVFDTGPLAPGATFEFEPDATVAIPYRAGRFEGTIQVQPRLADDEIPGASPA